MAKVESSDVVGGLVPSRTQILNDGGAWESVIDVEEETASKGSPGDVVVTARRAFATGRTRSLKFRRAQLRGLLNFLEECRGDIEKALYQVSARFGYFFI